MQPSQCDFAAGRDWSRKDEKWKEGIVPRIWNVGEPRDEAANPHLFDLIDDFDQAEGVMASSDEDLLPPPLLPIKPPPPPPQQSGLAQGGRGERERGGGSGESFGDDDFRREPAAPSTPASEVIPSEMNMNFDRPAGCLPALLAKVRALGLMSSRSVNPEAFKTKTDVPRRNRGCPEVEAVRSAPTSGGGDAGAAGSLPAAAVPTLLFNAPTAFDIFALHHNPIVLAIRAYHFDLLQKQVLPRQFGINDIPITYFVGVRDLPENVTLFAVFVKPFPNAPDGPYLEPMFSSTSG